MKEYVLQPPRQNYIDLSTGMATSLRSDEVVAGLNEVGDVVMLTYRYGPCNKFVVTTLTSCPCGPDFLSTGGSSETIQRYLEGNCLRIMFRFESVTEFASWLSEQVK